MGGSPISQIFLTSAEIVSIINAIRVVTHKFLTNFLTFMRTMGIIKDNEIRYQLLETQSLTQKQETSG